MLKSVTGNHGVDVVDGKGIELYDANGKVYLDLNEISTVLGQKNEHFNKRMSEKLNGLIGGKIVNSAEKEKFYRYLSETTNNRFQYIHLTSSGSEASEWAVRMALKMTGRNEVLSFWNSIHGRTYLSASMSGMPRRKQGYAPAAPGVVYGVYPDCAHCPFEKQCDNCNFFCLKFLDEKLKYESSQEIGAVIVEAYQGAGIIVPPKGWLKALQDWAHEQGALFILDEIQSGMGRTGKMYCFEEEGLDPDILLLGKALGNGIHVGAVLMKDAPEDFYRLALVGGAGDTEFTYAAGCAVFEELLENRLLEHISEVSNYLEDQLFELREKCTTIKNICCKGLAASIELYDKNFYDEVMPKLKENGLLVGAAANNKIVLRPPYVITKENIDDMISVFEDLLK